MNSKNILLIGFIALLFLPLVYSANFEVNIKTISDNVLTSSDTAKFVVEVKNLFEKEQRYRYEYDQLLWNVDTDPLRLTGVLIKANETSETTFKIRPKDITNKGLYYIPLKIYSEETKEEITTFLTIYVGQKFVPEYSPLITAEVTFNNNNFTIDPRNKVNINIKITNQNARKYDKVDLVMVSKLFEIKESFPLGASETKRITYTKTLDSLQEPIEDSLLGEITAGGVSFKFPTIKYSVVDYTPEFEVSKTVTESLMKSIETYSVKNIGNNKAVKFVKIEVDNLRSIFSDYTKKPDYFTIIGDKKYANFKLSLDKENTTEIIRTYNYKILYTILGILLLYILFKIYTIKDLIVEKKIKIIKSEGAISRVKVSLIIHNKTRRIYHDVEVADAVPSMFNVSKEFPAGSVEPYSFSKTKDGKTILKWHLNELEEREERIIHYEIKANLSVIGNISLPYSIVRYKYGNKYAKMTKSNEINTKF